MELEKQFNKVYQDYDKYFVIPVAIIALSLAVMGYSYVSNGEVMEKGLDFTGGTEVKFAINDSFETQEIASVFSDAGRNDVQAVKQTSGEETSLLVRIPPPQIDESEAQNILEEAGYQVEVESLRSISSSVSEEFFVQAQLAFAMAFTIMSLVIFYAFKDLTPSLAVIFAAAGDIIFAMAGMVIFNIPLTLGSFAALLMLIGYSVDTDIVLSTRVLRQQRKSLQHRIWTAIKTGVTMSSGGITGFALLYLVSNVLVGPSELSNIAAVMVLGLIADIPLTYFGNALILKKYVEGDFASLGEWFRWK
ncbi:MAG: protein translocase subunit SecF [Nanohaloarchaea archaeon SW_7_43_1]|nr:MAG: protein translocase subunit SecF [Nanohaloarchaea archaeon SW_7_43_1]